MTRLTGSDFFVSVILIARSELVVIDKSTSARSGADSRTVTVGFYYDGGIGVDATDGFRVQWLGINGRMIFGAESVPSVHDFSPASPYAGKPGLDANGQPPAGTIEVNGERYWLGSFQATVPSGQTEETTYNGELQLTIS